MTSKTSDDTVLSVPSPQHTHEDLQLLAMLRRHEKSMKSSQARLKTRPGKFSFSFTFIPLLTKVTRDFRGCNTMYQSIRSKYYFLKLGPADTNTNHRRFQVYTNDQHMADCQNNFKSTSSFPNKKFIISKLLSCKETKD